MDRLGVDTTTIRYEDFVAAPTETLDHVFSFAGVDQTAEEILEAQEPLILEPGHSVSGNPRRLERKAVEIRADEAWRSGFDPKMSKLSLIHI